VCELIELLVGVVRVTPGIHVLDGVHVPHVEGVDLGVVCPHWPSGLNGVFCNRNVFDSSMKS